MGTWQSTSLSKPKTAFLQSRTEILLVVLLPLLTHVPFISGRYQAAISLYLPQPVLLCPQVSFASLLVKLSAAGVALLIACVVELFPARSRNLCSPQCSLHLELHCLLWVGQKWDSVGLAPVPPYLVHLAVQMDLFWPRQAGTLSLHPLQDDGCFLETSTEVWNKGCAPMAEAKENLRAITSGLGVSWPTSALCSLPAKCLVLHLLLWHVPAFSGTNPLPTLPSLRTYCQSHLPRISLGVVWGSSPLLSGMWASTLKVWKFKINKNKIKN